MNGGDADTSTGADKDDEVTDAEAAVAAAAAVAAQDDSGVEAGGNDDAGSSTKNGDNPAAEMFANQLKELTESIATSFDSIASTMEDLRVKTSTLTSLSASFVEGEVDLSTFNAKTFSEKDIDRRLMMLEGSQQSNFTPTNARSGQMVGQSTNQSSNFLRPLGAQKRARTEMDVPEIDLNPRAKTVGDLWDEWMNGYRGQKSLQYLETQFGTKWRRGRIAKSAQRRKKVVEFIAAEMTRFPEKKPEQVVQDLDDYRKAMGKGIFWLYGNIPDRLYYDDGTLVHINGMLDSDDEKSGEPDHKKIKIGGNLQNSQAVAEATAAAAMAANNERAGKSIKNDSKDEQEGLVANESTTDPALAKMGLGDGKD